MIKSTEISHRRIPFLNPLSNKMEILKLDKNLVEKATNFPIAISTSYQNEIITVYIDGNFTIRAIETSPFLPEILVQKQAEVSLTGQNEQEEKSEEQFQTKKTQFIADLTKTAESGGKILMIGVSKVGKTSIAERLAKNIYNTNIKPTLGTNITKFVIEELSLQIYDIGGQEKLRKQWYRRSPAFAAIVYVLDISQPFDLWEEDRTEFRKIVDYYYSDAQAVKKIPLLILGNKEDLIPQSMQSKIEMIQKIIEYLGLDKITINYHVFLSSVVKNIGILPGFRWLIRNYLKMNKVL